MVCWEVPKASQFKQAHKQQTEKYWKHRKSQLISILETLLVRVPGGGGGALGYFLGVYVPPGTPNWHPVLKKIFPKIDTPF